MILSQPVAYQPAFSKKNSTLKKGYITHGSSSYLIQSSQNQFDSHHINRHRKSTEKVRDITKAVIIQQTVMNTPYQDDIKSRRRFFTQEEDLLLTNAAIQYNEKNWANIAKNVPGRTPRQCRDRWMNYLKPNLKFDPWSKEEDALLTSMVNSYGTHWAKIVAHFPGRSTNAIKNRWNSSISKRIVYGMNGMKQLSPDVSRRRLGSTKQTQNQNQSLQTQNSLSGLNNNMNYQNQQFVLQKVNQNIPVQKLSLLNQNFPKPPNFMFNNQMSRRFLFLRNNFCNNSTKFERSFCIIFWIIFKISNFTFCNVNFDFLLSFMLFTKFC